MPQLISSFALVGIDAVPVTVEVDLLRRLPQVVITGLSAAAVRESADRIRSAITASGYVFPRVRVVVSLSPVDLRKDSNVFDLAIAVGILRAVSEEGSEGRAYVGELSLAGDVRPVRGVVAMARAAKAAGLTLVCHPDNARDARALGCAVLAVRTLRDAMEGFSWHDMEALPTAPARAPDFSDVREQAAVIAQLRAATANRQPVLFIGPPGCGKTTQLRAAAANRQPVLFIGPPGCGKTTLAARMSGLLAPLTEEERVEVAQIQDAAGLRHPGSGFALNRPMRAPHHSISLAGLVGNSTFRPGECSLAHKGVLFLDDLPLFASAALETLGAVVLDRSVRLARAGGVVDLPADFWLVAAANPCACLQPVCVCSQESHDRYDARLDAACATLTKHALEPLRIHLAPAGAA